MRQDGRSDAELRPIKITRQFTRTPAGSVLWEQGQTVILCTASVSQELPPWFRDDQPGGWLTAEYVMLPASTPQRKPWPRTGHTDSRGTEIQRLIGRCLRAGVNLACLGPHTLSIDCQVLQADGGTRTASICAAYVAIADALRRFPAEIPRPRNAKGGPGNFDPANPAPRYDPKFYRPTEALTAPLSAVSVGLVEGEILLDLDYHDDSRASVDLNVAYSDGGKFVEIQGSAENGEGFDRGRFNAMLDLATVGCRQLHALQRRALEQAMTPLG